MQRREIDVLKMCQQPNIVRLIDVFENHKYFYIVLEYMDGGDMFDYLKERNFTISEERARQMSEQIACALYYLHSYGIMHRDLKLENIMMTDTSETSIPKLVDFGLSKIIGPLETANEPFGTVGYAAPEILKKNSYGK
jgi:serine/threonine protein kinase